jgi:tetratricopeptide (TPR) repeat protein
MFTDMAGFTERMERDETGALASLAAQRQVLSRVLDRTGGSLVKEMGDGTLSVFPSTAAAVRCARGFQELLRNADFRVRIGIHWGEVLQDEDDVFGDTVNVASRLEEISAPGGVCVSGELLKNLSGRKPGATPLGLRKLKGLGRLVEVYDLTGTASSPLPVSGSVDVEGVDAGNEAVPSIAVMLLENLGAPSDSFYAYGITADLVSDLARAGRISVVPLSETLGAMDTSKSALEAGRRLGTGYVVKGALWKKDTVFQLAVELYSVRDSKMVWTDKWQEEWYNLPSLKGKLADGILKALGLEPGSFPGITGTATAATEAYELYLQGKDLFHRKHSRTDVEKARLRLEQAISLDPGLIQARVMLGATWREAGDLERGRLIFEEAAQIASEKGDLAGKLTAMNAAAITQWMASELKPARAAFRQVLKLARSLGDRQGEAKALNNLGLMSCSMGDYRDALVHLQASLPISKDLGAASIEARTLCNLGLSNFYLGNIEAAFRYYGDSLELLVSLDDLDGQADVLRLMGIAYNRLGDFEKSLDLARRSLKLARDLGNRPGQCKTLNNMGSAVFKLGLTDEARGYFEEALGIASGIGDRVVESIALSNLGRIRLEREEFAEACVLFEKALQISKETGDAEGEGDSLFLLGDTMVSMGRPEAATGYLEAAIEIFERIRSEENRPLALALLARALVDTSPVPENIEKALHLLSEAEKGVRSGDESAGTRFWIVARACRRLEAVFLPEDERRKGLEVRYRRLVGTAFAAMTKSAGRISDPALKLAFLESIGSNKALAEAWKEIQ